MSYLFAAALQTAIYERLTGDADLAALVGDNIFDQPPLDSTPATYVTLGAEDVRDRSDQTAAGALHVLGVSVVTYEAGFLAAKQIAQAVSTLLHHAALDLQGGRLVLLAFETARARRIDNGSGRQIDLSFRARVDAGD